MERICKLDELKAFFFVGCGKHCWKADCWSRKYKSRENSYFCRQYSMFMAGENGRAEMLGTVGGKTAVAGGQEITGIRDAVYSTAQQEMELLRQQNQLLQGILEKEFGITSEQIGKSARNYAKDYFNRTGREAYIF